MEAGIDNLYIDTRFFSCATYNTKLANYKTNLETGDIKRALSSISSNRFFKYDRNQLLLDLEKGKLYHLLGNFDSSNRYFNLADEIIERNHKTIKSIATSNLINPMTKPFEGEDYEKSFVHYYKSLNYLYLNKSEDALVEIRRLDIALKAQSDAHGGKLTSYAKDAFLLEFMGIIYESNGEINNAFIAYRNALEVYEANNGEFYGTLLPRHLIASVINTAQILGFYSESEYYATKYKLTAELKKPFGKGTAELIVIIEQGLAPEKREQNFFLATDQNGLAVFYYIDENGNSIQVPFNYGFYNINSSNGLSAADFRMTRVAIPYCQPIYDPFKVPSISINGDTLKAELIEDFNNIGVNLLRQRKLTEIADAIARLIVKKLTEKGLQAGTEQVVKNNSNKQQAEKNKDAELIGSVVGLLANVANNVIEKADTRYWQSLPAALHYVRVPLKEGMNTVYLQCGNKTKTLNITGKKGVQIVNWAVGY